MTTQQEKGNSSTAKHGSVKSVLDHQARMDVLRPRVNRLRAAFEEHENLIKNAPSSLTPEELKEGEGLGQYLSELESELAHLLLASPDVMKALILSEMEFACEQYVRAALEVANNYKRIIALESMSCSLDQKRVSSKRVSSKMVTTRATPELLIPAFHLPACESVPQHDKKRGVLFSAKRVRSNRTDGKNEFAQQIDAERLLFEQLGVTPSMIP